MNTDLIAGVPVALIAAGAAIGSWRTAVRSNAAANTVTAIEQQRRHAELTPEFAFTLTSAHGGSAELRVMLTGPHALGHLDAVTVTILDERWKDHGARITAGGPSAEEIAKVIWGPYEFNTGAGDQVADARTTIARRYSRETGKDWDILALVPTGAPYWVTGQTQQQWLRQYDGQPLRLQLDCCLGSQRWMLSYDVHRGDDLGPS